MGDEDGILSKENLRTFVRYTGLLIPQYDIVEKVLYYLNQMEPYYPGSIRLFEAFQRFVKTYPNAKKEIHHCVGRLARDVEGSDDYQKFKRETEPMHQTVHPRFSKFKRDVFRGDNDGKWFVSLDLSNAFFHQTRAAYPDMWSSVKSWDEFLERYYPNDGTHEFLFTCKQLRLRIFGEIGKGEFCKRAERLCFNRLEEILECPEFLALNLNLVAANKDELIFSAMDEQDAKTKCVSLRALPVANAKVKHFQVIHIKRSKNEMPKLPPVFLCRNSAGQTFKCLTARELMQVIHTVEDTLGELRPDLDLKCTVPGHGGAEHDVCREMALLYEQQSIRRKLDSGPLPPLPISKSRLDDILRAECDRVAEAFAHK